LQYLQAASSITTWISLIAFVVAILLVGYRGKLKSHENIINSAPPDQRILMAREEAQRNGVDVSGLTNDQVFDIVKRNIVTKRYYAFLGLIVAIIIALVCLAYFVVSRHVDYNKIVGPLTLAPGETRSIDFNLDRKGPVTVTIDNIVADWTGLEQKRAEWIAEGRGNTPEIWFKICGVSEDAACHKAGVQRGIHGTFSREIDSGDDSVTFFNFRDSPPVSFAATIKY
jgi:hypothetical protein